MKVMIIAEGGSVHDGSFGNAKNLCKIAKNCGANAIKFQLHVPKDETLKNAPSPKHFGTESRYDYFERTSFTFNQWKKLKYYCDTLGIDFFVSVFSLSALKIVKKLNLKYIKIPSGEVTNYPLLKEISKMNSKILLSTGMSDLEEIDQAVRLLRKKIIIMQCTSLYPTQNKKVGLNMIEYLKKKYKKHEIGFSDHTNSLSPAIGATVMGVKYIEKHITFSKLMYGSDAKFSFEPDDFQKYCEEIRNISEILSNPVDKNNLNELKNTKKVFEKKIISNCNIKKNEKFTANNISTKKSKFGISAKYFYKILNKTCKTNIKKDTPLKWHQIK